MFKLALQDLNSVIKLFKTVFFSKNVLKFWKKFKKSRRNLQKTFENPVYDKAVTISTLFCKITYNY